jgi:hypothetical protein
VTRPFSAFGLVSIPDTGEADGVSVELMASAPRGVRGLDVEFRDVELLAVGAGAPSNTTQPADPKGAPKT